MKMWIKVNQNQSELITRLFDEAGHLIEQEDHECAVKMLQNCLNLGPEPKMRVSILNELGYCCLRLGWFEEAAISFSEYLKIHPSDNDGRFFLASAYASMKWTDEAMEELRTILGIDPTDVLARHDLALCFRNKGWLKESFEEMKRANEYAALYGNAEEKEIVKSSLGHIEEEIQDGDEDGTKETFFLFILLATVIKRSKLKTRKPPRG
jgi:tetratricopeptide (TPR) repeat protein